MKAFLKNSILFRFFDPKWMWTAVHPSSMGLVRVIFGILMIEQISKYQDYFENYLVHARYLLHYDGFGWLEMFPAESLPSFFFLMHVCVALIILGLFYRPAMAVFFLGQSYCFLLDKGHYNNHYYMISLVAFWMIFTHWNRWMSVDDWIARRLHKIEKSGIWVRIGQFLWQKRNEAGVPRWHLLVVQLIIFIVYFYGAIAKLNPDWLAGYPMRIWMEQRAGWPVFGPLIGSLGFAYFLSYAGILFDLTAAFILFSKKVKWKVAFVLLAIVPFHIINDKLWNIGVFPEMMMGMTLLFFDPALPARAFSWLGGIAKGNRKSWKATAKPAGVGLPIPKSKNLVMAALILFFTWQFLFPLRVHFYPWPAEWHTNSQHFSWRMMLTDRETAIKLRVAEYGQTLGYIRIEEYVTQRQYYKFVKDPPEIVRFANSYADEMRDQGFMTQPEIYATYWRSINGRPYQLVMDSTLNLITLNYHPYKIQDWLNPFENTKKKTKNFNHLTEEEVNNLGLFK
jgi:hypothetical protein